MLTTWNLTCHGNQCLIGIISYLFRAWLFNMFVCSNHFLLISSTYMALFPFALFSDFTFEGFFFFFFPLLERQKKKSTYMASTLDMTI